MKKLSSEAVSQRVQENPTSPWIVAMGNPIFLPDMEEAAVDALRNDKFLFGENVVKFEEEFARMFGYEEGAYPKSERLSKECLSLPMHPFLTNENVKYVCENISRFHEWGS
jgi:dTDP-4-amino-4,6-dideoxygalactose transaminase